LDVEDAFATLFRIPVAMTDVFLNGGQTLKFARLLY
jgi:hypothetical protein